MASGWGLTQPNDEESFLEGAGQAVELQFIWLEVISLSDCNDLAMKSSNHEKCKQQFEFGKNSKVTSNLTLCVVTPGNPKKGVEKGKCSKYQGLPNYKKRY